MPPNDPTRNAPNPDDAARGSAHTDPPGGAPIPIPARRNTPSANLLSAATCRMLATSTVSVVFGAGRLDDIGALTKREGARNVLLVTDAGVARAGHAARAVNALRRAGLSVTVFDSVGPNPTTDDVDAGCAVARHCEADFLVGLGGGSAIDCMKGINLLVTNGGRIRDYWGEGKARRALLPSIAIPTTAGTGSEAQSFALISDAKTHMKMACGDRRPPNQGGLRPRVALLDPDLPPSAPRGVVAATGLDAIAHAVESAGSTRADPESLPFSVHAWRCLNAAFPRVIQADNDAETTMADEPRRSDVQDGLPRADRDPDDTPGQACTTDQPSRATRSQRRAWAEMLAGAHLAGAAIERSMLGAAHACANPLTARFGIVHGSAVAIMLPHVVRFNTQGGRNPYVALDAQPSRLADRLDDLRHQAGLPDRLSDYGVREADLPDLARQADAQWTARFNPRPVNADTLLDIYHTAL